MLRPTTSAADRAPVDRLVWAPGKIHSHSVSLRAQVCGNNGINAMTLLGHDTAIGYSISFISGEKKSVVSYFSSSESNLFYFHVASTVTNQIIELFQGRDFINN